MTVVVLLLLASSGCLSSLGGGVPANTASTPSVAPTTDRSDGIQVTVTAVLDGDTVEIKDENGTRDTVRLLGVDTPEVHAENDPTEFGGIPTTTAGRRCLQRAGENATAYATDRLAGEPVTLAFDPQSERRDYYNRLLGYRSVCKSSLTRSHDSVRSDV